MGATNKEFEEIWAEWLSQSDLQTRVEQHLSDRQQFLRFVERFVSNAGTQSEGNGSIPRLRVLEVGCGTALDSLYLAERAGVDSYASDLTPRALRVAQRINEGFSSVVRLLAADLAALPFHSETFDLVFSQGVLEHFRDPATAIREQSRVTKGGGFVIIDVPQIWNPYTLYKKYRLWRERWPYGWETQYTLRALKRVAEPHGLRFKAVGAWGDTFGFTFRSKASSLSFLDRVVAGYFRTMNAYFQHRPYLYRQNISVCFYRADQRSS